jgi:hypothetical protein
MRYVVLAGCLAFAAWLFYPMLGADFWALDDHELVSFLPAGSPRLGISEAVQVVLQKTEVGRPGSFPRYRPSYYTLRVAELYLWHLNAHLWFAARFCLVLVSFALLAHLATGFLGPLCGGLLAVVALTPVYWGETWARTGTAEQYATLGLALFCVGAASLLKSLRDDRPPAWAVWLVVFGCILAAGSKELFLPTSVLSAFCLVVPRIRRKLTWLQLVALGFTIVYCVLIAWSVRAGIAHNGGYTIYGQHPDAAYLQRVTRRFIELSAPYFGVMLLTQVLALAMGLFQRMDRHVLASMQRRFLLAEAVGFAVLFWILVFYAGDWPVRSYYDFPGLLLIPACIGLCLFLLDRTLAFNPSATGSRLLLSAVSVVGLVLYLHAAGFPLRPRLAVYAGKSRQYQEDLTTISRHAATHPAYPIVFSVAHPSDDESVYASRLFLHAKGVDNPFYVIAGDLVKIAGSRAPWVWSAEDLKNKMAGRDGFRDNLGLPAAVAAAGGAYIMRCEPDAPQLDSATELPLRWR